MTNYPVPQTGASYEKFREIRVAGSSMADSGDIPDGHFYIVDYDSDQKFTDIGDSVDCIVLRQAMKTRGEYKQEGDRNYYMYDSSEFLTFNDIVVLYNTGAIPTRIEAALPYSHKNQELPAIGGKGEKALKDALGLRLRYVYYILYKGETYRMYGGSTDFTGADANDKPYGFNKPEEGSFLHFLKSLEDGETMFTVHATMTAKQHSKKIVLKRFAKGSATTEEEKALVEEKLSSLYESLNEQHWNVFGKAMDATDMSKLDEWSRKVVDVIKEQTFEGILMGQSAGAFNVQLSGEAIEVQAIAAPKVEDVVSELEGDSFPPSEADMKKHKKKLKDMQDSL